MIIRRAFALNSEIIKKIREFNRYYTVWLNVLNKGYLGTDFSWTESRVLFEIDLFQGINATELCEHLNMDKSHISRILAKFEKQGLLTRELILGSKGLKKLWLTEAGKREAQEIDQGGDKQILDKLKTMDDETCDKLCEAMVFIEKTLRDHDKKGIEK
ncbi:MarR family transcriptional regulator [Clostridiales bacterium]|nr:MarR family transcriptional regulator [Clostridiales bacterium]